MFSQFYDNVAKYVLVIDKKVFGLYIFLLLIISCFVVYKSLNLTYMKNFSLKMLGISKKCVSLQCQINV